MANQMTPQQVIIAAFGEIAERDMDLEAEAADLILEVLGMANFVLLSRSDYDDLAADAALMRAR